MSKWAAQYSGRGEEGDERSASGFPRVPNPVSYTHLTLPTTPYV